MAHNHSDSAPATAEGLPPGKSATKSTNWRRTFESLRNPHFLLLWVGMLCWMLGSMMQYVARGYLAYDLTGSASLLGVVNVGASITTIGLALHGGAIADRIDRKLIIQVSQVATIATVVLVGLAITTEVITWHYLLISSVVQGAVSAFMMPARQAIIPQIVGPDNLTNALALSSAAMSSMILVGPAIAGWLYALTGPDVVYYVIAGVGVVALVVTSFVPSSVPTGERQPMTKEVREGLTYLRRNRLVLVLVITGVLATLLSEPYWLMLPVYVVEIYNRGPEAMGLLISVVGAGSLVGSLIAATVGHWYRGRLFLGSVYLTCLGLILIAAFPFYYAAVGFTLILGLGESGRWALNQALIMQHTENRFRGRVSSIFSLTWGVIPLGTLPYGVLIDLAGGRIALGALAGLLGLMIVTVTLTQSRIRSLQ